MRGPSASLAGPPVRPYPLGMRIRLLSLYVTVVTLVAPAVAWAQTAPPEPGLRRTAAPWVGYLVIFVLLAVVLAVSLIPSKRGHQD